MVDESAVAVRARNRAVVGCRHFVAFHRDSRSCPRDDAGWTTARVTKGGSRPCNPRNYRSYSGLPGHRNRLRVTRRGKGSIRSIWAGQLGEGGVERTKRNR